MSYRVFNLNTIHYSPGLDETKVVRWIEPEKKVDGVYSKIIYPDGILAPEKTLFPDFNKVDKMKL